MKLKIYQINQERGAKDVKFMNSDWLARHTGSPLIDPGIYDGLFQPLYMNDGTILVCNEEAKLMDMAGNRRLDDSIIAGPFFVVGSHGEEFRSLTNTETEKYMARFAQPEQINQQEVRDDMSYTIISV